MKKDFETEKNRYGWKGMHRKKIGTDVDIIFGFVVTVKSCSVYFDY